MQPVPPTKITAKTAKPLHPTSAVVMAKTKLPPPDVQTTITQKQTHKVSSIENTVCVGTGMRRAMFLLRSLVVDQWLIEKQVAAAPMPSDDMDKFLRRWAD